MKEILKFKYSFAAVIATIFAIVLNLICVFNIYIIVGIILFVLLSVVVYRLFYENYNLIAIFACFFILGLTSSFIYNAKFRVYPLPNYLDEETVWVAGTITDIKIKDKYARVFLTKPVIYTDLVDGLYIPNIIVSSYASRIKDAKIGDKLVASVMLENPKEKLFNDDFDYAKYLLENRINLTGQVRGDLYITEPLNGYSLWQQMANYRLQISTKIGDSTNAQAVATALITGIRGKINNDIKDDFKNSGLAHLMAISGMHMAFLAAIIFLLVRYVVCLVPAVALHYDSKKIAGFFTIGATFFYLLLAGASLPTVRAFFMITLFVITMMLNRSKVALHTVCVVAIFILLLDPMAVFSASFQLSFSAVFAMLVFNQIKQKELVLNYSLSAKLWRGYVNSLNISIIAFTATMFVVSVHFGYLSVYAIVANVIASFLMALVVMPALFVYFIGYIVLDIHTFSWLSEYSLTLLLNVADYFAHFANSSVYISPNYAFVLLFIALLILTVIIFNYGRKYIIATVLFVLAFYIPIKLDLRPDVIEFSNGSIALRNNNELILVGSLEKRDLAKVLNFYKLKLVDNTLDKSCDITGCVYYFKNKKILQKHEGFEYSEEDLTLVDYVIKI